MKSALDQELTQEVAYQEWQLLANAYSKEFGEFTQLSCSQVIVQQIHIVKTAKTNRGRLSLTHKVTKQPMLQLRRKVPTTPNQTCHHLRTGWIVRDDSDSCGFNRYTVQYHDVPAKMLGPLFSW